MDYAQAGELVDGRFRVGLTIGKGSFGIVKAAVDESDGSPVAIKMLLPQAFADDEMVARFYREAEISAVLSHPNTVRMIHFGNIPRQGYSVPYMALELIRGIPLGGLLSLRGQLDEVETSYILARVLDSLHDAHMQGIVHRDLKPNNIMIEAPRDRWTTPTDANDLFSRLGIPGPDDPLWKDVSELSVKVVDFGLGKLLEIGDRRVKKITLAGVGAGTAEYMSPEQVRGDAGIDHRADIYGVAMLIYRLITGKPAFDGPSRADVAIKHLTQSPPPLPGEYQDHPLNAVYRRASAKEPAERYGTVEEMAWELRGAVDEDYEAIRALMASGVLAKPQFEAPPAPRLRGGEDGGQPQPDEAPADGTEEKKRGFLSRIFKR